MDLMARFAVRAGQLTVQVDRLPAATPLVEIVNILCYECKCWYKLRHRGDCPMRSIRLRALNGGSAPFVPSPHERRISPKRTRGCQFHGVKLLPKTRLLVAESRYPTLRRNAGSSEHDDSSRLSQGVRNRGVGDFITRDIDSHV